MSDNKVKTLRLRVRNSNALKKTMDKFVHAEMKEATELCLKILESTSFDDQNNIKESYVEIKQKEKVSEAMVKILINDIHEIMDAQENLLVHMEDPECNHQIRVKIRRLRAILSFSMPLFNEKEYRQRQEQLGKMGLEFSKLREADVLLEEIEKMTKTSVIAIDDFSLLKNELNKKRKEELQRIHAFLLGNELMVTLVELWAWLLEDPWTDTELLNLSIKKYSEQQLELWQKRIKKNIKKINMTQKEEIHKIRIRSKKLRYAMEELGLILDKDPKKSVKKFEKLQEDLGYFHDLYINKDLLEKLVLENDSQKLCLEAGIIIGWQANQGNWRMKKYL